MGEINEKTFGIGMIDKYDTLVVVTPDDFERLRKHYGRLLKNISGRIIFVGNSQLQTKVERLRSELLEKGENADEINRIVWMEENDILSFSQVHELMSERLSGILMGCKLPRKVTGWYYQQFIKMQYSFLCEDKYYMVWDGDTLPCRPVSMFQEDQKPIFDMKEEFHKEYFDTLSSILPGMGKVLGRSFISEHMLINKEYMKELIAEMERNSINGDRFWEKILHAIPSGKIQDASFSEFETYGTYCTLRHMGEYTYREWHSFRLGAEFFDLHTMSDRDFEWLGKDFDAISFEKGQYVREDHRNLFMNPKYQEKLSARKMLESIQDLFNGGYVEVWGTSDKFQ